MLSFQFASSLPLSPTPMEVKKKFIACRWDVNIKLRCKHCLGTLTNWKTCVNFLLYPMYCSIARIKAPHLKFDANNLPLCKFKYITCFLSPVKVTQVWPGNSVHYVTLSDRCRRGGLRRFKRRYPIEFRTSLGWRQASFFSLYFASVKWCDFCFISQMPSVEKY